MIRRRKYNSRGFTLLETILSLGIFSIFTILVVGAFSRFVFYQKLDISEQNLQEDARLALETMNREIRTGYGHTFQTIQGDSSALSFVNQNGQCVFFIRATQSNGTGMLMRAENSPAGDTCTKPGKESFRPLTNFTIDIRTLNFTVTTADLDNAVDTNRRQGIVTTSMALAYSSGDPILMWLQTSITSRQYAKFQPV